MSRSGIISRVASLLVAALWIGLAATETMPRIAGGPVAGGLIFGLPLIWFPETISSTILPFGRGPSFETPPGLVAFAGWIFLLGVPLIVSLLADDVGR